MTAAEMAAALGGAYRSGAWWRCVCPVHGSRTGRSATLALRDGDRGIIVHCHAGCAARDILAELRRRGVLGDAGGYAASRAQSRNDSHEQRVEIAGRIWAAARDARGSPVVAYLAARGITTIAPPTALRWAPSLRRPDGTCAPAMVARIDGPDGKPIGIHRTWLARDPAGIWRRRDRAMLGRSSGGAVRFADPRPGAPLLIAEGVETTLAAMTATGLPGWAALSAGGIERLILPPEIRDAVICADHDRSGRGESAAQVAAQRWHREGRRVSIWISPVIGEDANDRLLAARGEARHAA